YVRFDFGHNYNQTSREAVYEWFGKWLLKSADPAQLKEALYQKEPDSDLRVFPNGELPKDTLTREQAIESLKTLHRKQWQSLVPHDEAGLKRFNELMLPAWRHTLQLDTQEKPQPITREALREHGGYLSARLKIIRGGEEVVLGSYRAPWSTLTNAQP